MNMRRLAAACLMPAIWGCADASQQVENSAAARSPRPPVEEEPPPPPAAAPAPGRVQAPAPPGPPRASPHGPTAPWGTHIAEQYGISIEEAQRRLDNETHVSSLNRYLRRGAPPGFSSLWIQHEPSYAVVVAFKGTPDRAALLARAHPAIRRDIVFRPAKRDRFEIERDGDRIVAALQRTPGAWSGGYDVNTQKFGFNFATKEGLAYAERIVPADLRDDVVLRLGGVPVPLSR